MNRKTLFGVAGVGIIVAVGAFVFFQVRNTTTPVDADAALSRFEQAAGVADATTSPATTTTPPIPAADQTAGSPGEAVDTSPPVPATTAPVAPDVDTIVGAGEPAESVRLPLPEPGVYRLALQGSESLDLLDGASHEYPDEGFLTVTPIECGVELRFDFIVERWQSLTLCDGEDGPEIAAEQTFHSFFGQDSLVVLTCTDSPLGPGADRWTCAGESTISERSVSTSVGPRAVADGSMAEVLIFTTELVLGDHPDDVELIEQWWDVETGLPVYEWRTYDAVLDTTTGDARYVEEYELVLTSFEPIT